MRCYFLTLLVWLPLLFVFAQEELPDESEYPAEETYSEPTDVTSPEIQNRLDKIALRLQLTPDQRPQIQALLQEYLTRLTDNPPASPEDKRAQRRALRSQVMQILTPAQKARLQQGRNKGTNRQAPRSGQSPAKSPGKRKWLDVLLDDVASPLMDRRRKKGHE